jgi:hypothetical protein
MFIPETIVLKTFEKSQPLKACELGVKRNVNLSVESFSMADFPGFLLVKDRPRPDSNGTILTSLTY